MTEMWSAIEVIFACLEKLIAILHLCMKSPNSALLHTSATNWSKMNRDDGAASRIQLLYEHQSEMATQVNKSISLY